MNSEKVLKAKPRKLKKKRAAIVVHDVDLMNKRQLQYYALRLQKELRQIQNDCNLNSDIKNRLVPFIAQEQDKFLGRKYHQTSNDFKQNDILHEFEDRLKNFRLKSEYLKLGDHEQQVQQSFSSLLIKVSNKLLTDNLEGSRDAARFVAIEGLLSDIITIDMNAEDLFGNFKNWPTDISFEYVLKCRDAMLKFSAIKQRILNSIWKFDFSDEEPISIEIEKLQFYFNELHEDNVKALQKWQEKVTLLEDQLEELYSDLNKALKINVEFKKQSSLKIPPSKSKQEGINNKLRANESKNVEIDKDVVLNLELKNKLQNLEEELSNLKNKFVSNVRKIYRIAEFKSYVAEEIMRLGLAIKDAETSEANKILDFDKKNNGKINQESEKTYRLIKMSCFHCDTLFVPPVF